MGNSTPAQQSQGYDWDWLTNENGLELYKNKLNGLVAEKRLVVLDNRFSWEKEKEIYDYRQNNNEGLVRTYHAEQLESKEKKGLCNCGTNTQLAVYS